MIDKAYDPKAVEDPTSPGKSHLSKAYDPTSVEDRIYDMWEKSGAFTPEACDPKGEPFTISMPPPNATGQLHLGHAVMLALQDIFIRFARMRGKKALWVPGTDHAAIATENVVIKQLKDGGMRDPRKELGREKLVEQIADFVEKSKATIRGQVRKMGSSCDWSRERYTFEPALNRCVNEVFKKMYDDGLIYRGHRIVNWDPKLQTTVSDDEVVYREEKGSFYTFTYGPFQISTARPETKFGDKYVVMHPKDKRYSKYKHGDTFEAEWINGPVRATVIKDDSIDMDFGTGVMTITPWHDKIDFEIAERHGLEKEQIIDFDGKLLAISEEFAGMSIDKARPLIVEKLKSKGLLVKVDENYVHNKAVSQRGGGAIEPQIKLQWFIDVNKPAVMWKKQKMSLREVMHDVVHHGDITIIPERFSRQYMHWVDKLHDWCISRQIWWGHRVPVYYCTKCKNTDGSPVVLCSVNPEPFSTHELCGAPVEQDQDTLDTWFSSALWTWSTLVDPKLTADMSLSLQRILADSLDYQTFHPTQVMETGYDILPFWVARMILMTTYATGEVPFRTVYLHGLIRTRDGAKMSKSHPETMIDPLDMISKYGADALRLSMIVGQSPGADSRLYEEKIAGYRNFINKLWNASRFVLMQCEQAKIDPKEVESGKWKVESLSLVDKAVLFELDNVIGFVTDALKEYHLSMAGDRLYTFVWDFFCDWYLELSKGTANCEILIYSIRTILKLLHPYCPFVTEELWSHFSFKDSPVLIKEKWPQQLQGLKDVTDTEVATFSQSLREMHILIDVITAIRKLRTDQGVEPGTEVSVTIVSRTYSGGLEREQEHIRRLGRIKSLTIATDPVSLQNSASAFLPNIEIHLSLAGLFDPAKLKESLEKEQAELRKYIGIVSSKLKNKSFAERAPKELVDAEKKKLTEAEGKLQKIEERLTSL